MLIDSGSRSSCEGCVEHYNPLRARGPSMTDLVACSQKESTKVHLHQHHQQSLRQRLESRACPPIGISKRLHISCSGLSAAVVLICGGRTFGPPAAPLPWDIKESAGWRRASRAAPRASSVAFRKSKTAARTGECNHSRNGCLSVGGSELWCGTEVRKSRATCARWALGHRCRPIKKRVARRWKGSASGDPRRRGTQPSRGLPRSQ